MPDDLRSWIVGSQLLPARVFRFALVGGATSGGYVILVAVIIHAGLAETFAAALAYLALLPLNYLGHRRVTWRSQVPKRAEALRFLGVHGVTMLVCMTIMAIATGPLHLSHWAGALVIVILAPLLNLAMFDLWVFRRC